MTTRQPAPDHRPVALTIAGSDSGGGAGIQADLKTMEACGVFGTSAITSVTAQNTRGVDGNHLLPTSEIEAQIDAVREDFDLRAVKTGMLATAEIVETVTAYADDLPPLVVDPVMVAASGDRLLEPEAEDAYEALIAESTVVTPNADEAAVLTDVDPDSEADAEAAGAALVEMGADAALVKGGHMGTEDVVDVLVTADDVETFRHPRVATDATHGSGCTLSSAIAAHLATGADRSEAVSAGIDLLARAVRYPLDVGRGPGAVHHTVEARELADRDRTAERVEYVLDRLGGASADARPLVPDCGATVVGATRYAERPDEVAAVEGKISRTRTGIRSNRGVRFGVSDGAATVLLAAREADADLRYAFTCRYDADVAAALETVGGSVVELDRSADAHAWPPTESAVRDAVTGAEGMLAALVDPGAQGVPPRTVLFGTDAERLSDRALELLTELGD
ncbi:bifunctional hydroxymethylpyrimidine kinase/phosphomethylpyrimidine kinase [Halorientalis marina]|uniref:bifunctional hydroxymethylpyrimidine kinase/phosphomethylpyrimidine kinase n=1 Tax=Halorientalis marina TaxID=2931976 RepID=UPI001FF4C48E|nr:bifunctional hydroxymethylpyrimidine kinase/phosphomethylpyrimidine kinase [Halorientalis marina]